MNSEDKFVWTMELTEEQYNHIALCVETCHRIACGDINELRAILPHKPDEKLCKQIKQQVFPELDKGQHYKWCGGYATMMKETKGDVTQSEQTFDKFQAQGYQIYRHMVACRSEAKGLPDSGALRTLKAEQPRITRKNP